MIHSQAAQRAVLDTGGMIAATFSESSPLSGKQKPTSV